MLKFKTTSAGVDIKENKCSPAEPNLKSSSTCNLKTDTCVIQLELDGGSNKAEIIDDSNQQGDYHEGDYPGNRNNESESFTISRDTRGLQAPPPLPDQPSRPIITRRSDNDYSVDDISPYTAFDNPKDRRLFVNRVLIITSLGLWFSGAGVAVVTFVEEVNDFFTSPAQVIYLLIPTAICLFLMTYCWCCCFHQMMTNRVFQWAFYIATVLIQTILIMIAAAKVRPETLLLGVASLGFLVTVAAFIAICINIDFTKLYFWCLFIVLIIMILFPMAMLAIVYFHLKILWIVVLCLLIGVVFVYLIMDLQLIMGGKHAELQTDQYVLGAIFLYSDIAILFVYILQLLDILE